MKRIALAAGAVALSIMLTACSSSSKSSDNSAPASAGAPASASAPAAAAGGIIIKGFAFTGTLTVKAGSKVSVTNQDSVAHNLVDAGGKFDSGTISGNGGTGSFTAPAAGTYQLKCTFHPQMSGTLVVQ